MRIRSFNCVSQVVGAMSVLGSVGSGASATLTVWTNQAAWEAQVQPQWHLDFPEGIMTIIPPNYYASEGIQLTDGFLPAIDGDTFRIGSTVATRPFESRGVLHFNSQYPGMLFDSPVDAVGLVTGTFTSLQMWVKYANGTTQTIVATGLTSGWNFIGLTSTIPIIGYMHATNVFDEIWLSNAVPAPATVMLLALCGVWRRRTR